MKKILSIAGILSVSVITSQAVVVWTGASDSDFFNDANWDFTGAVNGTSTIDPSVDINEDLTVTGASGLTGTGRLDLGGGYSITLNNSSFAPSSGVNGFVDGDPTNSVLNILGGSSMTSTWLTEGLTLNVDGTSSYTLRGAGDPINSQTETTRVNLSPGAMLTLSSVAEFTEQGADIFVNGVSFASDPSILSFSGNTGTAQAIPEPSGSVLVGLAGLAVILRRRK
ncbi:MAG: PEP-CTERM sorting domain-containing protein [Verrucomicrobiaceae bacterium]